MNLSAKWFGNRLDNPLRARPQSRSTQGIVAPGCEDGTQEAPADEAISYRSRGRDGPCEQQVQLDIIGIHERIREFRIIIILICFLFFILFAFVFFDFVFFDFVFFDFIKHWSST